LNGYLLFELVLANDNRYRRKKQAGRIQPAFATEND
jgi:hypothetical protein